LVASRLPVDIMERPSLPESRPVVRFKNEACCSEDVGRDRGSSRWSTLGMGDVLKVAADSKPKAVAGALAAVLREKGSVELQAVGAGAVNQAVKAIAITRGYVAPNGMDLIAIPAFTKVEIEGEERTAIRFLVQAR